MAKTKLNRPRLYELMSETGTRQCDLARRFGLSRQLAYYIVHCGSWKYAARLAKFFDCEEDELLLK